MNLTKASVSFAHHERIRRNYRRHLSTARQLPRSGPGSEACTIEALRNLPPPPLPKVLDLGCGTGAQTLVLAKSLGAKVMAVDLHQPSLDRLQTIASAEGLDHLIETRRVDFSQLDVAPGSVDLIWSEGAAYVLGFEEALRRWRPLLAPRGLMADAHLVSGDKSKATESAHKAIDAAAGEPPTFRQHIENEARRLGLEKP